MAEIIADELKVCVDCAQIIANGEIDDGTDRGQIVADLQVQIWGADAFGLVLSGDLDEEPSFSWSSCDGCGSTLGGDRFEAAVLSH